MLRASDKAFIVKFVLAIINFFILSISSLQQYFIADVPRRTLAAPMLEFNIETAYLIINTCCNLQYLGNLICWNLTPEEVCRLPSMAAVPKLFRPHTTFQDMTKSSHPPSHCHHHFCDYLLVIACIILSLHLYSSYLLISIINTMISLISVVYDIILISYKYNKQDKMPVIKRSFVKKIVTGNMPALTC